MKAIAIFLVLTLIFTVFAQRADVPAIQNKEEMSTKNQGEQDQLTIRENNTVRAQEQVRDFDNQTRTESRERYTISSTNIPLRSSLNYSLRNEGNSTKINVKLSNGRNAEVKVMPETASEVAIQRLRLNMCSEQNNCSIELKEVGQGEQTKAVYEVQAQKQTKILGIFATKIQLRAQVDAETGEVRTQKPWWSFLAVEN
ncbi:MAG: hypothetical protein QXM68_01625 [Candidatus Aenigmatarchaeota archaeon]|nr:hypothetical protein [Candidatus Aenigmarchaeota archaeon]